MLRLFRCAAMVSVMTLCPGGFAAAQADGLDVVASFSIIGDFAKNVGGDRIHLTTIVGPDGDAHVYEPSPADATAMAKANVVLVNGLHFEGFLQRLVETSGTKATVVELTKGVTPLEFKPEFAEEDEGARRRSTATATSIRMPSSRSPTPRSMSPTSPTPFAPPTRQAATATRPTPPPTPRSWTRSRAR